MRNFSRLIIHRFLNTRRVHLLLLLLLAATPYTTEQSSSDSSQYPYGFDDKITPSMTVIIVVLVCAFFFMGFFTIYIRQCTENSAMVTSGPSAANGLSRQSRNGLDPAVIESFPIFVYWEIKDIKIGKGALECAVCLSEFEGDENLRLLPKCDHVFHPECIDTWFASHTTCPVCRADLTLISRESAGVIEQRGEPNDLADERIPRSEVGELQDQVSINVENALCSGSKLVEIMNQSRRIAEKFPRSHSTGHSLVQPGENCERYKLTLPDEVRKQMMTQRLKRTTSCGVVLRREGSSKRGYTSGGEGSSRGKRMGESDRVGSSDRWLFKMTPPFFTRTGSVRSLKVCADKSVLVVGSSKVVLTSVKTPVDRHSGKGDR